MMNMDDEDGYVCGWWIRMMGVDGGYGYERWIWIWMMDSD